MTYPYPEPTNPLPWTYDSVPDSLCHGDAIYLVRAANAFPHLVAALEALHLPYLGPSNRQLVEHALAIARGETPP